MRFVIDKAASRAEFTAYAPMHKFKGWAEKTIEGELEANFEKGELERFSAKAITTSFDTGDESRNKAMMDYFSFTKYTETSFYTTEAMVLKKRGKGFHGEITGILELAGVRRQLPVNCGMWQTEQGLRLDFSLKWSFKAFGMKAPRLLFLTVRDIVDIEAVLRCNIGEVE